MFIDVGFVLVFLFTMPDEGLGANVADDTLLLTPLGFLSLFVFLLKLACDVLAAGFIIIFCCLLATLLMISFELLSKELLCCDCWRSNLFLIESIRGDL